MRVDLPAAYGFLLLIFRAAALCMSAPLLGMRGVPMRSRMALATVVAAVAFSGAGYPHADVPGTFLGLGAQAMAETVMGLCAGLSARIILDAAQTAGQLAGTSMGFGFGALLDPVNGTESTMLGQLFSWVTIGVAVALGIHREALGWLALSVHQVPPGTVDGLGTLAQGVVVQSIYAVTLAIRLGLPLLAAVTFGHAVLGIMGRAAPQIQISSVGFAVAILAGGTAVYALLPHIAHITAQAALRTFHGQPG